LSNNNKATQKTRKTQKNMALHYVPGMHLDECENAPGRSKSDGVIAAKE
jgi:hypothetical protein